MYIEEVMTRVNYLNTSSLRSAMGKGYALAVERLFLLRSLLTPVDLPKKNNWTGTIIHNLEREKILLTKESH